MAYMARQPERRSDPSQLLPGAKSVLALIVPYEKPQAHGAPSDIPSAPAPARVARYARGKDYHRTIGKKLDAFARYAEAMAPGHPFRTFVDSGPLLERPFAQQAGIGFIGKNTMLITQRHGSWVFLAHVLTTLELEPDAPDPRSCGECRICIDACPTDALAKPYYLDARRCISYWTIEHRGPLPEAQARSNGDWLFGCDICQDVCPHNRGIREAPPAFTRGVDEVLAISNEESFSQTLGSSALARAGRTGLVRNACAVAANQNRRDLLPALERLAQEDPDPVVRDAAERAARQLRT